MSTGFSSFGYTPNPTGSGSYAPTPTSVTNGSMSSYMDSVVGNFYRGPSYKEEPQGGGGAVWESLFANLGGIAGGAASVIAALRTSKQPQTVYIQQPQHSTGISPTVLLIGCGALLMLMIFFLVGKR